MTPNHEKCVCCGQSFPSLTELLAHIKIHHTETEVLEAITEDKNDRVTSKSYV